MPLFVDRTGNQYGKLLVLKLDLEKSTKKRKYWICACECGKLASVNADNLSNGRTKSCGCLKIENQLIQAAKRKKWGEELLPTRHIWKLMIRRCYNTQDRVYRYYGGRGIIVCDHWQDFCNFLEDMGVRPEGLTLDRLDVNGNYCPENCRWASMKEQARNRTNTRWITINNQVKSASEWCEIYNQSQSLFHERVKRGWNPYEALITPPRLISQDWRNTKKF